MASVETVLTSRVLLISDSLGYEEIYFDIKNRLNISKPIFIYINDEKSIKVEQIRELQQQLASPPLDAEQTRVVVIHPLERLLHVAQQSLLKLLEEPPTQTLIVLAGSSTSTLAPTILSRVKVENMSEERRDLQNSHSDFWTQADQAQSFSDWMRLFSQAPDKKDEAIPWIKSVLQSSHANTKKSVAVCGALTEAYEALLSNVTPKLVWGRAVDSLVE